MTGPNAPDPSWRVTSGLFLAVAAAYVLTSPGRLDIIDGQWRYDVAHNLVAQGRPAVTDPYLRSIPGLHGSAYAPYSPGASVLGVPLVFVGRELGRPDGELERFLFSWTSPLFGGLTAALLYRFLSRLTSPRRALGVVLVQAFCTLSWPVACSTFDQAQHAFFVLLALFYAYDSAQRSSVRRAALGGLAGGMLLNFQESYGALLPVIAIAALASPGEQDPAARRAGVVRYLTFGAVSAWGALSWMGYNVWRFGQPLMSAKGSAPYPIFGDPITGLVGLTVSPGKGILFYSPTVLLSLWGIRALWRGRPRLGSALVGTLVVFVFLTALLSFFGGDWCWGPRYLAVVLPICALPLAYLPETPVRRGVAPVLVSLGLLVQGLALTVDHQRFFFERGLPDFFWAMSPHYYLHASQLFARPRELASMLTEGVPPEAQAFVPHGLTPGVTNCIFGNAMRERDRSPEWMRHFRVFYVPRPWPLWMRGLPPAERVVPAGVLSGLLLMMGLWGVWLVGKRPLGAKPG